MYKLGCKAAMQDRRDDTLEGAHSFVALLEANLPHFGVFFFKFSRPFGFSTICKPAITPTYYSVPILILETVNFDFQINKGKARQLHSTCGKASQLLH